MTTLSQVALVLVLLPFVLAALAFFIYPVGLMLISVACGRRSAATASAEWPEVTITLPVYNEEGVIAERVENILSLDYPADRRHVLVLSDCSSDRTDDIVRSFESRGVQLVRLPQRSGKGAAENLAYHYLRGTLVVNVDATTVLSTNSLKSLLSAFADPTVGVASGRDVSITSLAHESNSGEAGYVGYEMTVRRFETLSGGIVGASGCFFGIRREIYPSHFPIRYSRDFASPLIAHEHGFRSVSVEDAVCAVPRVPSLQREYKRKIRTMHRGLETLFYKRHLMNPFKHGWFAVKLLFHKLLRWLMPLSAFPAVLGIALLAVEFPILWVALVAVVIAALIGRYALVMPDSRKLPSIVALVAFIVLAVFASAQAWLKLLTDNDKDATWEPTRRAA